jgi:hypothetical protein
MRDETLAVDSLYKPMFLNDIIAVGRHSHAAVAKV